MAMKKIINQADTAIRDSFIGLSHIRPDIVSVFNNKSILIRNHIQDNKVALLIGGGSGHEPLFGGFVGPCLADGAVHGHFFAAPTPDIILEATKAIHRNAGVLYVYGNYAGDNMNFDLASEMAEAEGIKTKTVHVCDDVAIENFDQRRGIAGNLFALKVAGAAADKYTDLHDVASIVELARDNIFSIGVALKSGSNPETGEYTFELGDDEIEIGMGIHGEPGTMRGKMMGADGISDLMLDKILNVSHIRTGDTVCVLINNLGASTYMELLIVNKRVQERLKQEGVIVHDTIVGDFCTSQEMAGCSISLFRLVDEKLTACYDQYADSIAFTKLKRAKV